MILEKFEVHGVSEAQATALKQRLQLLEGQPINTQITQGELQALAKSVGIELPFTEVLVRGTGTDRVQLTLGFGPAQISGVVGGRLANPHGDVISDSQDANLVSRVLPEYPPLAKGARVQGVVLLEAFITAQGTVEGVRLINGHPLLHEAAIQAVKQWRYRPQAGPVTSTIQLDFSF